MKKINKQNLVSSLRNIRSYIIARPALIIASATLGYTLLTAYYYFGNSLLSCGQTTPTGIGDATAGLIWLNSFDGDRPWWGFTTASNYPFGEQIGMPFHILGQVIYIPFWLASLIVGPVCGYTLVTSLGFIFSAMAMFLFIRWLTNRNSVAFIAGLGVAFTPYLQYKTGLHPSYVLQGLFVLSIWLFMVFWREPNWKKAAGLGVLVSLFFYTDPYFVLLGGILGVGLVSSASIGSLIGKQNISFLTRRFILLGLTGLTLLIAISPIIYVQRHYKDEINSVVSSSRSDIKKEAEIYGARPSEYLSINANQPVLTSLFGEKFHGRDQHGSNIGETQLSLSFTLMILSIIGILLMIRNKRSKHVAVKTRTLQRLSIPLLLFMFTFTALLAFLFSLPPTIYGIPTPVSLLITQIEVWRVFARLQVIVNICLVITAAIGLVVILDHVRRLHMKIFIILLILFGVLFEYQSFFPARETWSYNTAPPAYHWLKNQNDITTIAEYPLDEPARSIYPTYYFSYQVLHRKNLINSTSPNSPQSVLRNAIRDIDDPQTVPTLRTLGVDAIIVHSKTNPGPIDGLTIVREIEEANSKFKSNEHVWVYRVNKGDMRSTLLAPDKGFTDLRINSLRDIGYQTGRKAQFIFIPLPSQPKANLEGAVRLSAYSATTKPSLVSFLQEGQILWEGELTTEPQDVAFPVSVDPNKPIVIKTSSETDKGAVLKRISLEND